MKNGDLTDCSRRCAFTLVEILAVVIIMGIIAGVTMMMVGNDDIYYAAGTARVAEQIIEYAQQEAVRTQRNVYVFFFSDISYIGVYNSSGILSNPFGSGYFFIGVKNEVNSRCYMGTVNMSSGANAMYFNSLGEPLNYYDGSPISDSNYVLFGCGDEVFKLSIKPVTGTIRITKE
ncbi:MAG TPA: type II secretion system protein [Phycisphaerae bacterium]|nr:type II secretion system protein [Phycisphaerae bacterium]